MIEASVDNRSQQADALIALFAAIHEEMADDVIYRMGHQVHRPALAHLSERELDFLHHMAALGPEPANTSKIAERMGLKANVASQTRAKLLNRELIAVPARGKVEFTLPYLREYLLEGRIP